MLPLALFRTSALRVSIGALSAMFGISFLLSQYLQVVRGVGPLGTGLFVLAYASALVAGSMVAGSAGRRRVLVTGGLLAAAAVHGAAALGLGETTAGWVLAVGLDVVGVGIGLAKTPLTEVLLGATGAYGAGQRAQ